MKTWTVKLMAGVLLATSLFAQQSTTAQAASSTGYTAHVQVNDALVEFPDAQPFIDENGRLQVPIRFLSETLGYKVAWSWAEDHEILVTLTNGEDKITLQTGEHVATVNGDSVKMDTDASLFESRTYVPIRFVSESFGAGVSWDENTYSAMITTDGIVHLPVAQSKPSVARVATPLGQALGETLVADAKKFIGVPYAWGGSTPRGFDCSGLIQYVYSRHDVSVPRTSRQLWTTGTGVAKSALQPGDLVFFSTNGTGRVNHVGISLGGSQFISATSSRGVKIDTLSGGYWGARYLGAKRVF
ncbi:MAG TPA: stalk domain-containing protein [Bacilli bacterium]|nr:stalk domain-containing protein [Bacilli bacterium]